jgi:AcrR family transcriptional regulator
MLRKKARDPQATRAMLVKAASAEFNMRGFHGTDTNRIARKAGFAPQTFYRHFEDKTAIFLAVYESWWQGEATALQGLFRANGADTAKAARIVIAFHTRWRIFRRSLRHLAIEDGRVRAARNTARKAQIARLARMAGSRRDAAEMFAALLSAERICDAAADGAVRDFGISAARTLHLVAEKMAPLIGARPRGKSGTHGTPSRL